MLKKTLRRLFPKTDFGTLKLDVFNTQIEQKNLFFSYQIMCKSKELPRFEDTGFRVFPQGDEDGKILYIFSIIGFSNKKCLDIAFASPFGSNTTNLILNWVFNALLIESSDFFGASLKAFVQLADEKGYRLVGTNILGYNAFFLKKGIAESLIETIDVQSCFSHPKVIEGMKNRFPKVKNSPWINV
ncbi:MAG: hypothetical protein ACK5B9_10965 [Flavobacteriia bacterium]|jgi:hypothetical protein